jgi:hypothetical protein
MDQHFSTSLSDFEPSLYHQNLDIEISRPETAMKNAPARRQNAKICAAETDRSLANLRKCCEILGAREMP